MTTEPDRFDLLEMDTPSGLAPAAPKLIRPDTGHKFQYVREANSLPISVDANPPPHAPAGVDVMLSTLGQIGAESQVNAAAPGIGSIRGGSLAAVGFTTRDGYLTAIRNGVPARTHAEYLTTLRARFGMTTADLADLPGPMVETTAPAGAGIVHVPTGPSVFDRPRDQRAFMVGAAAQEQAESGRVAAEAARVAMQAGELVAGAMAGTGAIIGWRGERSLTRGVLVEALLAIDMDQHAPRATSNRAQAGRALGVLSNRGFVVRVDRATDRSGPGIVARWSVGMVNHSGAIGGAFGRKDLVVELREDGTLMAEGEQSLANDVRADYEARCAAETYQAADITAWLSGRLVKLYDAVRFGVGWFVPPRHVEAAGRLCEAVSNLGWGDGWILPALPVATSDQLRDGIARGLVGEVDILLDRLATERAAARVERETALETHDEHGVPHACDGRRITMPKGDIGEKRAGTFLVELREIGKRIAGYGAILGEQRVERCREQVRYAITTLEAVLGDDHTGISARFANVWDEIERDRARSGGVL